MPSPPPQTVELYSPETRRAELARRDGVRANLLADLPKLGEVAPAEHGATRPDLWPPRPPRVAGPPARRGNTYDHDTLAGLVRRFAAARGPDFGILEFCRWAGVATATIYRHADSWPELRRAAGLPPVPRRPDRRAATLLALLRTLHLNRRRARPLSGVELARAAGVSRSAVSAYGGVGHLRGLYRLWAAGGPGAPEAGRGARPPAGPVVAPPADP